MASYSSRELHSYASQLLLWSTARIVFVALFLGGIGILVAIGLGDGIKSRLFSSQWLRENPDRATNATVLLGFLVFAIGGGLMQSYREARLRLFTQLALCVSEIEFLVQRQYDRN